METIAYQNKYYKIVNPDNAGYYILKSKKGNYNDQYFLTLNEAKKSIGVLPETEKYTFNQ